jgi:hypothetical protein
VYVGTEALTGKQLRLKPTVKTEQQAQAELGKLRGHRGQLTETG